MVCMTANLRLTLSDEQTEALDVMRGPATRTAYVMWLVERALVNRTVDAIPGVSDQPSPADPSRKPAKGSCKHERALKGWCNDCKTGGH